MKDGKWEMENEKYVIPDANPLRRLQDLCFSAAHMYVCPDKSKFKRIITLGSYQTLYLPRCPHDCLQSLSRFSTSRKNVTIKEM
jgi:hypothetical protein